VLGGAKGAAVTELGYDIRKPGPDGAADPGGGAAGPRGSHCGAGAPRFNVTTQDGKTYFIGCNSPPATTELKGQGWTRLRWGGSAPLSAYSASTGLLTDISGMKVKEIDIVFDEGQDTGPDNFGLAVIDNIDVNGTLVGHGPNTHDSGGDNGDNGDNDNGDD